MENLEFQPAPRSDTGDLQLQLDSLHHLMISILVLLVIISGTILIFLSWQVRLVGREVDAARPQVNAIVSQYEKVLGPAQDEVVKRLTEYGRTHSDFAPILTKYGITNAPQVTVKPPVASVPKK